MKTIGGILLCGGNRISRLAFSLLAIDLNPGLIYNQFEYAQFILMVLPLAYTSSLLI
jgi:hypothetical protein